MEKQIISTPEAAAPAGPYSQAVVAGNMIFVCGEKGVDPLTGEKALGVEAQTRQALKNIHTILAAAGSSLKNVVRMVVYMKDLARFNEMNQVCEECFPKDPPARTTVGVSDLPLDLEILIEVTAITDPGQ
jgi:2-iminobutanoate/2-iminopropanoate deaminase